MGDTVVIERRYRGPAESANGGYACGLLARALGGEVAEVTLRAPPPLDRPLTLSASAEGAELRDGETLIAEGRPLDRLDLEPAPPVGLEAARRARQASPLQHSSPYPECFVCGPARPDDGLGITAGPVQGEDLVAAPWLVAEDLPGAGDAVDLLLMWAALDCPSGIAPMLLPGDAQPPPLLLGRLAAQVLAPARRGSECVAIGWMTGVEGRKYHSATAIYGEGEELLGLARATWIGPRPG